LRKQEREVHNDTAEGTLGVVLETKPWSLILAELYLFMQTWILPPHGWGTGI